VRLDNLVLQRRSDLEVALKMRIDLVLNVVTTVSNYGKYESSVLERITEMRSRANSGLNGAATVNDQVSSFLPSIYVQVEQYPDLKATHSVQTLQQDLLRVEEKIANARLIINTEVNKYNTLRSTFPYVMLAPLFASRPLPLFSATASDLDINPINLVQPFESGSGHQSSNAHAKTPPTANKSQPKATNSTETRIVSIRLPRVNDSTQTGWIAWFKASGSQVKKGEDIGRLHTDGAHTVILVAPTNGKLTTLIADGVLAGVGMVIAKVESNGS